MRLGILLLVLVATLFGSGFWYNKIDAVCRTPITYRIGNVDSRFGTSPEEIHRIALTAEGIWEDRLKTDLFVYDENGRVPINLVFDERQQNADLEAELREDLEAKEGMSETVAAQYERLIAEFRSLKKQYESRVVAYEKTLNAYNKEVTDWNNRGGAPEPVLKDLKEEEEDLRTEQEALQTLSGKLNKIVADLNRIGARGNALIKDYNTIVEEYNTRFSDTHEFAQGDYGNNAINIYQFDSEDELAIVLAHEMGHALSLDHVTNERSIMYHNMGKQSVEEGLTEEDLAEYNRMCEKPEGLSMVFRIAGNMAENIF
jgi:predicted Zn-dependent protease